MPSNSVRLPSREHTAPANIFESEDVKCEIHDFLRDFRLTDILGFAHSLALYKGMERRTADRGVSVSKLPSKMLLQNWRFTAKLPNSPISNQMSRLSSERVHYRAGNTINK